MDSTANIKVAGKRIAWGKYTNSGQTCLAPDYILCNQSIRDDLIASIKEAVKQFYGEVSDNATINLVLYLNTHGLCRTQRNQRSTVE